jgi:hypothetical protein
MPVRPAYHPLRLPPAPPSPFGSVPLCLRTSALPPLGRLERAKRERERIERERRIERRGGEDDVGSMWAHHFLLFVCATYMWVPPVLLFF